MNKNFNSDTIAAISTALSPGGIGIVRVSGEKAIPCVASLFQGKDLLKVDSHTVHYGHIKDPVSSEIIDEVLVTVMKAPKTYTREDVVEINGHGGIFVLKRILSLLFQNGVRPAEPGEFTRRAFLNGRIDLSQAESVMDVISSSNELALKSSLSQLSGALSAKIRVLREKILHEIAYIEAALDDPEHYDLSGYPSELSSIIEQILSSVRELLQTADDGALIRQGIKTAIVGRPNAGKSSLMNALSKKERAIVTDIPGTTRDTLEEQILFHGIYLNVMDTAGIRETSDTVEKIGVSRSLAAIEEADFVIDVVDASSPLDENDLSIFEEISEKKSVILLNKSDLTPVVFKEDIEPYSAHPVISISAREATGIDELKEHIKDLFFHGSIRENDEIYITNERHKFALLKAEESLTLVLQSIVSGMPEDFYSIDLMDAYTSLGSIIGESVEDDLVNEIFAKFCMGK